MTPSHVIKCLVEFALLKVREGPVVFLDSYTPSRTWVQLFVRHITEFDYISTAGWFIESFCKLYKYIKIKAYGQHKLVVMLYLPLCVCVLLYRET